MQALADELKAKDLRNPPRRKRPRREPNGLTFWRLGLEKKERRQKLNKEAIVGMAAWRGHAEFLKLQEEHYVFMPFEMYNSMIALLMHEAVPRDRVGIWKYYGEVSRYCKEIRKVLSGFGINGLRQENIFMGLIAIEPYPSKKRIDRIEIVKVLSTDGRVGRADMHAS